MRKRIPAPILVTIYVGALMVWAWLAYDTLNAWRFHVQASQVALAESVIGPTATPTSTPAPPTVTPTSTAVPTVLVPATPTAVPPTKLHPKTGRYIAAWLPTSFDADQARASFEANKDILDEVSPFWYSTNTRDGSLVADIGARDTELVKVAHEADVLVIPTVHNVVDDPFAIVQLLHDPKLRTAHVAALMDDVVRFNYDGIDVDYKSLDASVRADYSAFMQELSAALHDKGKLLTVAVHAKTTDYGGWGGFQDWKLLGEICDRVRIMTYDYSWRGSGPGAIAPQSWVSQVGEYARAVVPPGKIQIGVPFYAYNWGDGESEALSQTWLNVQDLIAAYAPRVNFRERDENGLVQESSFVYTRGNQRREVWFANSRALEVEAQPGRAAGPRRRGDLAAGQRGPTELGSDSPAG